MALLIPADPHKPVYDVQPTNGTYFELKQLYELLSCELIEIRNLADGRLMILDDESKLMDKPRNERATRLAQFPSPKQLIAELLRLRETGVFVAWLGDPLTDEMTEVDYIAGDALICEDHELR